ncbi:MAG TPA: type IV toxin-antitoxin system AbiEi family antitoxin domain-containing protein [Thermoleophilaceae bacterium]|jgi:very-short-patch-repair endonuclease
MEGKLVMHPVDGRIAELAARQHGVVTRTQLMRPGFSSTAVDKRVRAGRLHRLHRGVYAVGHTRLSREGRFMAAVLACGPRALLSHGSAALHWGLPWRQNKWIDVTVPTPGGRRRRRLVVVHRARLEAREVSVKDGVPVTSPSRTLVDLADYGRSRPVERALDEAAYLRLDVSALLPRQGRRGSGVVAELLARHDAGTTRTRSDMEEIFLALCRDHGLPEPQVNTEIEGYEADFAWPPQRLIIETDGHGAHGTRAAFERDRLRDAELVAAGWRVVRITYGRLLAQPQAVAAQLSRLL